MKNIFSLLTATALFLSPTIAFHKELKSSSFGYIEASIQEFNRHIDDLSILDDTYLGKADIIDLTSITGISVINDFKAIYSKVELPNLTTSIALFSGNSTKNGFSYSTKDWQENWRTDTIKLNEAAEDWGTAYIYGILSTRIEIIKHSKLNHLLLRFHFYGAGNFESTGSRPWGSIQTGWVLRLVGSN